MKTRKQELEIAIGQIEALRTHYELEGDYERAQYCEQTLINLRRELVSLGAEHSKTVKPLVNMKLSITLAPNTITNHKNLIHIHRKHSTGNKLRELVTIESILNGERGAVLRERVVAMLN
jgi:hypothetical protein